MLQMIVEPIVCWEVKKNWNVFPSSLQTAIKMDSAAESHRSGHVASNETDETVCLSSDGEGGDQSVSLFMTYRSCVTHLLCHTSLCGTSLCGTSLCSISLCTTSLCSIFLCHTCFVSHIFKFLSLCHTSYFVSHILICVTHLNLCRTS